LGAAWAVLMVTAAACGGTGRPYELPLPTESASLTSNGQDLVRYVRLGRAFSPAERETLSNGARKAIYRDSDGNELVFGGTPLDTGLQA
jgi:hypothetical protein